MIDLHTHSTASDGTCTPTELIRYAASKSISVMALTDHDTTAGLTEAQEESRKQGILFVPGIEITINWPTGEFHLLGLGLKRTSPKLRDIIASLKDERRNRNQRMAEKLRETVSKSPARNLRRNSARKTSEGRTSPNSWLKKAT